MSDPDLKRHAYMRKIFAMQARGEIPPGVHSITAAHDETCGVWKDEYCDCDPEIRLHVDKPKFLYPPNKEPKV